MTLISRSQLSFILLLVSFGLLSSSCQHEADSLATFPEVCFQSDVLPIFVTSCGMAGCHDNSNGEANYTLTNYDGILGSVVPGDPGASPAYRAIIMKHGEGMMPPSQPLSKDNRTLIRLWIYQGANNTSCTTAGGVVPTPDPAAGTKACFTNDILPVLLSGCAVSGCHDAATNKEGFTYTSYTTTMGSVRAGSLSGSKLYQVITTTTGEKRMPPLPYNRFTTATIDTIAEWIKRGALNETCSTACDTVSIISFNTTLLPVIQNSCRGCHSGTTPQGGVRLESYANVATIAASGALMGTLKGTPPHSLMPPGSGLTVCRITQFKKWIANGYPDN
jgi:hypothetical protein